MYKINLEVFRQHR